jgi:hypothetical protein
VVPSLAHRLNKPLFGVLIEDLTVDVVPKDLSGDLQLARLASDRDGVILRAVLPVTHEERHVTFSEEGLQRCRPPQAPFLAVCFVATRIA